MICYATWKTIPDFERPHRLSWLASSPLDCQTEQQQVMLLLRSNKAGQPTMQAFCITCRATDVLTCSCHLLYIRALHSQEVICGMLVHIQQDPDELAQQT